MQSYLKFGLNMLLVLGGVATTFTWPQLALAAGVVGTGTPASCTEMALTTALTGGGLVTFNCGPNPAAITVNSRKTIIAATTLDGGGKITLNGSNGVFLVPTGQALTLKNLIIGNSTVSDGAIDNRGRLSLQNVTIKDNKRGLINNFGGVATIQDSTFQNNGPSSAIFNQNSTLTINDSSFLDNNAFLGGAIDNESNSNLTVTNSVFNGNTSGNGGGSAIYNGGVANVIKSSFTNNSSASAGGAIYTNNVMTITQSTIISNSAVSGGGIQSREHVQVIDSRISNNTSTVIGGSGIYHNHLSASSNSLTLVSTTLDGNSGGGSSGGGIYFNSPQGILNLTNVTLSGNSIQNGGGGLYLASGTATLVHTTLSNNAATGSTGDNLQNAGLGTITLKNSLITSGTCSGTITDGGGNMQDAGSAGCEASLTNDPLLGLLQDNGGWTPTRALASNSPSRNAGNNANCVQTDQRGVARLQDGQCDIGAFEYGASPALTSINPNTILINSPSFTIQANGLNFLGGPNGSRVLWDGTPLATTWVSSSQLEAVITANYLTTLGTANITVQTLAPDGGVSGAQPFNIVQFYEIFMPIVFK